MLTKSNIVAEPSLCFIPHTFRLPQGPGMRYTTPMRYCTLLPLLTALPCLATELPPMIPTGPVQYSGVSYDNALTPAYEGGLSEAPATDTYVAPSAPADTYAPISTPSSDRKGYLNLNAYSTNYQVRGMGLTDEFGHHGYSSLSGSYTLPNRNLLGLGIQQRLGGELGQVWGADDILGDTPVVRFDYAVGKEIFPNLMAEAGYSLHHGGMEGIFSYADGCPHRLAQDATLALRFDDRQHGFFAHALWGIGFQGLTGSFFDVEGGYRFAHALSLGNIGADVEISAGIAPSLGYWGSGVEGVDAYRLKLALPLFTHNGTLGHDAHPYVRPWVSAAWSGSNAAKIDRAYGVSPVDHFQFTLGVDLGWNF